MDYTIGLLLLFSIISVASSTSCPPDNLTRGHLTRCDKYFQCVVLPSQRIIWVSKQCDEGLVYNAQQGQCVVPDLNWECDLGDDDIIASGDNEDRLKSHEKEAEDQENVYGVNNFEDVYHHRSGEEEVDNEDQEIVTTELSSLDAFSSSTEQEEFSGDNDGTETTMMIAAGDTSTEQVEMPITPDQDGTVKSYLQRLTQLIDGFRKNGGSTATEITPDQLNSFVVMHKIKSNKNYDATGTHLLPENGNILKPHLEYILKKQYSLNTVESSSPAPPPTTTVSSPVRRRIIHIIRPYHRPEPEDNTNIRVSSQLGGISNETGLGSNSQIVVNRPEGSVLFNIARPAVDTKPNTIIEREPTISQETLKSVLELSKQLVSHQKLLSQNPNYLPPVVQPVYYSIPLPVIQQSTGKKDYFHGEAHPVKVNETATYQEIPLQQKYQPSHKYQPSVEHVNPYQSQHSVSSYHGLYGSNLQQNGNYNSEKNPFGYYNSGYNNQNYGGNNNYPEQESSQYYNAGHGNYNPHRPPYYDASGLGQSGENTFNPYGNYPNYPNAYQEQNFHSANNYYQSQAPGNHGQRFDQFETEEDNESTDEDQVENEESVESNEKTTTAAPVVIEVTTTQSPLSNLQLLSNQLLLQNAGSRNKIVGINGNYMSLDSYKQTILPILNTDGQNNLEIVSCSAGIRQANASDCTRYYVCNPKDGNLLGYTCPPYTAFNEMSRICDASSWALCKPDLVTTKFTIQENKRIQYEAQKTLQEAKRIRDQVQQAQDAFLATSTEPPRHPVLHAIKQKFTTKRKPLRKHSSTSSAQTVGKKSTAESLLQSLAAQNNIQHPSGSHTKRRKYKCADTGQAIPDVLNRHKYFVCFKDTQGKFKRRSMSCSNGLIFCSKRRMCTLRNRC